MDWKQAFLAQAISDLQVYDYLNVSPDVEDCHRLHYLQMMTEKLGKSFFTAAGESQEPPKPTHAALVRLLQQIKGMPQVRRRFKIQDTDTFRAYVDSLLPLALQLQSLAPAIAGVTQPNPEYPWYSPAEGTVLAPCDYDFRTFRASRPQMVRLLKLIRALAVIAKEV